MATNATACGDAYVTARCVDKVGEGPAQDTFGGGDTYFTAYYDKIGCGDTVAPPPSVCSCRNRVAASTSEANKTLRRGIFKWP